MYKISSITQQNQKYSSLLKEISHPPKTLYVAGNTELLNEPSLAVVGSRAMTTYGEKVCRELVHDLSQCGFTIVSGMATGIDATAHRTALAAGGSTIAVLGNGLSPDVIYPAEHKILANTITKKAGLLLSEYAPTTRAQRFQFPARNRIIAGLTLGTIIIEARLKSGALITAKYALEANREVFAVPGSIFSSRSQGVNNLLKQGATLVESYKDVLTELGIEEEKCLSKSSNQPSITDQQQAIIHTLEDGFIRPHEISQVLSLSASDLCNNLTDLEIKGIVRKNTDYSYSLT